MQSLNLDFSFSFQNKSVDISLIYVRKPTLCFVHSIFRFWFLVTFGHEVMKMQKYYVIFVYILLGKMGKTGKNGKKIMQLNWPKYQKPNNKNMGWTKHKGFFFPFLFQNHSLRRSHVWSRWANSPISKFVRTSDASISQEFYLSKYISLRDKV